jgi:hypothetical protein
MTRLQQAPGFSPNRRLIMAPPSASALASLSRVSRRVISPTASPKRPAFRSRLRVRDWVGDEGVHHQPPWPGNLPRGAQPRHAALCLSGRTGLVQAAHKPGHTEGARRFHWRRFQSRTPLHARRGAWMSAIPASDPQRLRRTAVLKILPEHARLTSIPISASVCLG